MRVAALAVLSLLVLPVVLGATGAGSSAPQLDWRSKADAKLLQAVEAGTGTIEVVLQGPALPAPASPPATRAAWSAYWEQASAPFVDGLAAKAASLGGEVYAHTPAANAAHVRLPASRAADLVGLGSVLHAGLDYAGATQVYDAPSSPATIAPSSGVGIQTNLDKSAQLLQVDQLWALGYHGEGVKVAMIDTGVRPTHEMFKNANGTTRVVQWHDATPTTGHCATPCDTNGHGTHTASTMGGSNLVNANSPKGMAPAVTLLVERIFQGGGGEWSWAQEGLQAAFDAGADITSNSWGGSCGDADAVVTANLAENLTRAGMISVFAAGNNGPSPASVGCPGLADLVITVGAVDEALNVAGFSSRGPCTWPFGSGATRICPDVMAIGVNVNAAWNSCDTCYQLESGTSMATPHVAGIVALLEQAKRATLGGNLSAPDKEVELLLRYSAKDLGAAGPDNDNGWGLAQAKAAYDLLTNPAAVNLQESFSSPPSVLHARQSGTTQFTFAELGSVTLRGHVTYAITQQDGGLCPGACEAIPIADQDLTLGALREASFGTTFNAANHAAGTYNVDARLQYSYVDPVTGDTRTGELKHTASFLVKKVQFVKSRDLPTVAHPGDLLLGGVTLRNVGNENATSVQYVETYQPAGFAPVPLVPPATGTFGLFADPAPSNVRLASIGPVSMEYTFTPGSILAGMAFAPRWDLLAAEPGSYAFHGALRYNDESGALYFESLDDVHVVALPV